MKTLLARKCKDGWLVEIKDGIFVTTLDDVRKIIRENKLVEVEEETTPAQPAQEKNRIYAW